VFRLAVLLSLAAIIGGAVLALTTGSLLGALLIIGGIGGLGWAVLPELFDHFTVFLSTGSFRRRS
jgi:hypothetical protein